MPRRLSSWLVCLGLLVPTPLASLEAPLITLTTHQTVYLPGDTLRLLVALSNAGPSSRADVFVGLVLASGEVRFVDPSLRLIPARREAATTFVPLAANVSIPDGLAFPGPSDLSVDTNGDGVPDAAPISLPIEGLAPGAYIAFAALAEPDSAAAGSLRLLAGVSQATFEIRAAGAASASGAAAITPDGACVFVVNPDSGSVSAVSTRTDEKTGEVAVGEDPRSLVRGPEGRRLYVTSQRSAMLAVLDAERLTRLASIPVGAEPYGVVADPRGHLVYVASSALAEVEVVDVRLGRVLARIPVGPKPMGLAVSPDGARLYVTHFFSGDVSVIDLGRRTVLQVIATGRDSNMVQKIVLHPTNGRAYLPHIRSNDTNQNLLFDTTVFPVLSAIDLASGQHLPRERLDFATVDRPVNMPFDVAFSPDGQRAYVVHLGSGDLPAIDLATQDRVAHLDVGDGPRGIVVTPDGRRAYVANSLSGDVSVVDLTGYREVRRIPVTVSPLSVQVRRGKLLFFSSRSPETSRDRWISCASCHLENEQDARTWFFPTRGPRSTKYIRGATETGPFAWSADRDEIEDFEFSIRDLMGGTGLIRDGAPNPNLGRPNAGRSADWDAIVAFIATLRPKPSPFRNPDGSLIAAARRGAALFERPGLRCVRCHPPPRFTDSSLAASPFIRHGVGTGDGPDERLGPGFDTPSLLGLWDSAPYLHDGSALTLRDVFTTHNVGDRHAPTSRLSEAELQDLIAYLLSL